MTYGICNLSVIPCRAEPKDASEMVTQLLFGEHFSILETKNQWRKIKVAFDDYEAWIDSKQMVEISKTEFEKLNTNKQIHTSEICNECNILLGSNLPFYDGSQFKVANKTFESTFKVFEPKNITETALLYINAPYLWGGRSPFGIDCSGFTQMVYKLHNIKLPRDAYQQAEIGETVNLKNAAEGNLAYFDNDKGKIIHVGIVLKNNKIIHASGKVRIDELNEQGILNNETNQYSHKLCLVKKIG